MDMTIIGFTVGGFALLTFGVRIVTRLTTNVRTLYVDDWVMLAAVVSPTLVRRITGDLLLIDCDWTAYCFRLVSDTKRSWSVLRQ